MIEYFKNLSNRAKIIWSVSVVLVFLIGVGTFVWVSQRQNKGVNFELKESAGRVSISSSSTSESSETKSEGTAQQQTTWFKLCTKLLMQGMRLN